VDILQPSVFLVDKIKASILIIACSCGVFGLLIFRIHSNQSVSLGNFYENYTYLNKLLGLYV